MGLFDFLKGKSETGEGASSAATVETPSPTPPVKQHVTDAAHQTSPDSPFQAPDAWDIAALTAPLPEPTGTEKPEMGPVDPAQTAALQGQVIQALKTVFDPEIPVDIYELGLIYDILVDADRRVLVKMTLTSPACPSAQQIPSEVRYKVKALPDVKDAWVEIVWEPQWTKERMSEAAKLTLGMF